MIVIKSIEDVFNILEYVYVEIEKKLEDWQKELILNIIKKLTEKATDTLINSIYMRIYVKDEKEALQNLFINNIKRIDKELYIYLMYKIINLRNLQKSDIKIKIYIEKYDKYTFEVSNLLDSLLFLINYTDSKQGLSINTNKIDELNTGKLTDVAKGAQKSLTTTLIGKKKNDKFVVHPNCKKEIVSIEKLGKYLDLNNKSFNISCPICNKKYTLAEDNIKKIINVQNNKIQFNCKHIESEDYITQMPFSIDLKDYLESNTKEMKKIMFFVNNFKRLTLNAQ